MVAVLRIGEIAEPFCPCYCHIEQSAFLFKLFLRAGSHCVRKYLLFQANDKHHRKLQAFGGMDSHERHFGAAIVRLVQVGIERHLLQKVGQEGFVFPSFLSSFVHKGLHSCQKHLQVLASCHVVGGCSLCQIRPDATFFYYFRPQGVGV